MTVGARNMSSPRSVIGAPRSAIVARNSTTGLAPAIPSSAELGIERLVEAQRARAAHLQVGLAVDAATAWPKFGAER